MRDDRIIEIPINLIKSLDNSRLRIEKTDIVSLMEDIKHRGLLQPIGVYQEGETYIIRYGNRRLESCKKLGWKTMPCIVANNEIDEDNFMADNMAENLHRKDLSPIELAEQCKRFIKKGYSISEISALLTLPKGKIENAIKIFDAAPETFKKSIAYIKTDNIMNKKGKISVTVANEILTFSNFLNDEEKNKLLEISKKEELSGGQVRLIKNLIKSGSSFNEAVKNHKEYKLCAVEIPLKISELKKYNLTSRDLFKNFILGEIKPNKNLLF